MIPMIVKVDTSREGLRKHGVKAMQEMLRKMKSSFESALPEYSIQFVPSNAISDMSIGDGGTVVLLTLNTDNIDDIVNKLDEIAKEVNK